MPFQKRKRDQQGRKQKRQTRKGQKKRKTTRKHWEEQRQNTGRIKTKIFIRFNSENGTNKEENKRE